MAKETETAIVFAVTKRPPALYAHIGPNETSYPIRFEGVTTDENLTVDNFAHSITSQLVGTQYHSAQVESEDGEKMLKVMETLDGITDDDTILEKLETLIDEQ